MVTMREANGRHVLAAAVAAFLVALATGVNAAPKHDDSSAYEHRLAVYRRLLAVYKQKQVAAAQDAASTLATKLEEQHVQHLLADHYQQYRHAQYLAAKAAAKRLSDRLERLYGKVPKHVAAVVHVPIVHAPAVRAPIVHTPAVVATAVPRPATARKAQVAQLSSRAVAPTAHHAAPPARHHAAPAPRELPQVEEAAIRRPTLRSYGWGKL